MEAQDFMTRTNSILLGTDASRSTMFTDQIADMSTVDWLNHLETKTKKLLQELLRYSDFQVKYDLSSRDAGSPMIYVYTSMPSRAMYLLEAFPSVVKSDTGTGSSTKQVEELVYHRLFESVIERYTKSSQKPNQALRDTRSAEFCYRLTVKVEAVPLQSVRRPHRLTLLREFLILKHLWESYRHEMMANLCGPDQMIGFPMPFEFTNVAGSPEFDLDEESLNFTYFNVNGKQEKLSMAVIPQTMPNASVSVRSTLSYMSRERLGPSLSYLMDLMRTQNRVFSMSSALKIYDQLISRLMVMHRYGVVHCDTNPASIFFGPGESCNVLYLGEFGSSLLKPEPGAMVPRFHDRFVSHLRFREKKCHFVHDIESAFYIFLYMMLGRLPWDTRMATTRPESVTATSLDNVAEDNYTDKAMTVDNKEKFWQSQDMFNRSCAMIDLEFHESLYKSFSVDLLESLYSKTREIIVNLSRTSLIGYMKESGMPGSPVYNIYFGLRRIIGTYFRFETLSPALKDTQASSKIELLNKQSTKDERVAWDLSHWCWNYLDPRVQNAKGRLSKV